ncbi:YqaJ viral recombinase family protein [uncultured Subdoligranulum sp.]|uniref:YqaJ viral recombinase family nuclease n=1 Tax=uncultured Subdoligranulum sp. TaxID=512298 RepID=UPI002619E102|nr:YqaJ viral recombinase family protein [uncultured Subdoligranulum sp.]
MPTDSAGARQEPEVLVDTAGLSEAEWLAWRRKGIGGSDAAAILGISPWRTARDLYDDKLGIASAQDDSGNWVALEMGHLLEDLVARIFSKKTGYPIFQIKKMFRNPRHPCMLADVDYFATLPDGNAAILEIKTTNYNTRGHWWEGETPIVPPYYESQGRHYMAVMDLDRVFFCCLYGNNEDEVEIRELHRDRDYEQEIIFLEESFWKEHVLARVPPPYTEDGELVLASLQRRFGAGDGTLPKQLLGRAEAATLQKYLQCQEQKKALNAQVKEIDRALKRLQGQIVASMGACWTAGCQDAETQYLVSYPAVRRAMIGKDALERLRRDHPEIYDAYVTMSESRRFSVKQIPLSAAQDAT